MTTLITPEQVVALAFSDGEYLPSEVISRSLIMAAEERYLRPLAGAELCAAWQQGLHADLLNDFVLPALALGVRLLLQPRLRVRVGGCGVATASGEKWQNASEEAAAAAERVLRVEHRTLQKRLSNELERLYRRGELPEYDPRNNILNHCRIHGNLVQTL